MAHTVKVLRWINLDVEDGSMEVLGTARGQSGDSKFHMQTGRAMMDDTSIFRVGIHVDMGCQNLTQFALNIEDGGANMLKHIAVSPVAIVSELNPEISLQSFPILAIPGNNHSLFMRCEDRLFKFARKESKWTEIRMFNQDFHFAVSPRGGRIHSTDELCLYEIDDDGTLFVDIFPDFDSLVLQPFRAPEVIPHPENPLVTSILGNMVEHANVWFIVMGEVIPAYSGFLFDRCLYLRQIIESHPLQHRESRGGTARAEDCLVIADVELHVFKWALSFIYTNALPVEAIENWCKVEDKHVRLVELAVLQLLLAANQFGLPNLESLCVSYVKRAMAYDPSSKSRALSPLLGALERYQKGNNNLSSCIALKSFCYSRMLTQPKAECTSIDFRTLRQNLPHLHAARVLGLG